jgi:tetratricopeptide (TPR) repeat protein
MVAPLPIGAFLGALPSAELVAREVELKRVLAAADATATGNGRLVLISGEPGVGKTRLAQEVMLTVRNRRFLVAAGRCYEQQRSVPFYPFIDILSTLYSSSPESIHADVALRWPHLLRLLPDVGAESSAQPTNKLDDQMRLFRAVTGFLQAISAQFPVAIFLDDLHVADGPSLELLQHIARSSRGIRLLVVGTYRDVEVGPHHPLEAALSDLTREELIERVPLRRLEQDGTEKLIAAALGNGVILPDLVTMVHRQAEGNSFFIQQLVRFLVERGDLYQERDRWVLRSAVATVVPESIRSVIGQRLARLGGKTQEALGAASVLGQTFRFETVVALTGEAESEIEAHLEEARTAGLVLETPHEGYTFDHVLTQQVLYGGLPTRKRHRLHLAAAEALEVLPEKTRAPLSSEIARHFLEAAQEKRAIPYALAAGDHAISLLAYKEANHQYSVALDLAQHSSDVPGEVSALTRRARLAFDMFQGKNAARDYERLLVLAQKDGDRKLELVARLGLEGAYYVVALDETEGDSISRCRTMSETAYDLARDLGDKRSMVVALLGTRNFQDFWPEYRNRWRGNAMEAMTLSREAGDPELVVDSELATWRLAPRREAAEFAAKLIRELRTRNDLFRLNRLYFELMWTQIDWGEYEAAVATCDAAIRLAAEIFVPPVQYPTLKAMALLGLGRYGEAWESLQDEVVDSEHPFGRAMQVLGIAHYYWELQDLDRAEQACRDLQKRATQLHRAWMNRAAAGWLARSKARRGELDDASRCAIQGELGRLGGKLPHDVEAEVLLAEGKYEQALADATTFADEARGGERMGDLLIADELKARALLYLKRPRDAVGLLQESVRLAQDCHALPAAWKLLALRAQAFRDMKDVENGRRDSLQAAGILKRVGDSIRDPEERARFFARSSVSSVLEGSE